MCFSKHVCIPVNIVYSTYYFGSIKKPKRRLWSEAAVSPARSQRSRLFESSSAASGEPGTYPMWMKNGALLGERKKAYFTDIFILCHFLLPNLPRTGKSNGGCSCHKSTSAPVGLQFLLYCFQEPFLLRNELHNILETPHMVIIDMAY